MFFPGERNGRRAVPGRREGEGGLFAHYMSLLKVKTKEKKKNHFASSLLPILWEGVGRARKEKKESGRFLSCLGSNQEPSDMLPVWWITVADVFVSMNGGANARFFS